ncbi:tetratricopeptide repeat protein [Leptospira ilyithenensis]|uniref:Tetratricopeptide repeat protein n=1 Tax=Leptospira ilyithenensis TaxID=2484901 RepID=A0A4V6QMU5_9LEPT|nr:tetratricopeptide repeat protein [Leptospira ilyithenensis]TGN14317.1 tetratricopeptide repeat protein [Leptospira ilyithenensis]
MKKPLLSLFIVSSVFLWNCQSRDFRSVSVSDKLADKATTASDKENLEAARLILAAGNNDFQKGKFEEAIAHANEANGKYETVEAYSLLGASKYQLGEYAESKEAYGLGERLDSQNEKLLIGLGTVQSTLGENEEATTTYQKLVDIRPDEPVYKYKVGTLLKAQKKYQESYVTLKPLEENKNFPYPVELLNQLGDVCLELKKYDEAESYFAKAEALQPDLKSAGLAKQSTKIASLVQKGNDAVSKKQYDIAISEYKKATDLQPSNASLWTFLGNAYFLKTLYTDSEASFRKALSLQDSLAAAYLGLANVQIRKKSFSECLKTTGIALKKSPRNAELKNKQGICEWKWGQIQKATLSFQDSSVWDKNFFEPKLNLAYVLLDQGRNAEAIEVLKKAESHPHANKEDLKKALSIAEAQLFVANGDQFLRQGKKKQALEEYGRALGRSPKDPSPHNAFGRAYFVFGEYKKSESSYQEALRNDPENLGSVQGLARLYAKTGDSKKEKEYIKRLEKLSADDPFAAITLGRIAEDAGKYEEAESTYLGLKKKFPDNEALNYRLASLYYKKAVEENEKENYSNAADYIQKSKKYSKDIPEVTQTEKTIQENARFAEILPWVAEGNWLYDKKKYDEAIVPYQKAYNKIPKPSLLVKIAECYMAKGEEEKGIAILEKAAKENKDNASSFKEGIYAFFYKKGETSKAEEGFNNLLREKPDSFYSYYMLGLIAMKKKEYEPSISQLDKSILLNGNFAPANVAKGLSLYKLGQTEPAKKEFEKARVKDINFSLSSYNLAVAYFNEDLVKESKVLLEDLKKNNPDFTDGELQLAYIYFRENRLDDAEKSVLSVLKEERSAEALFAHWKILDAKYKQDPDDSIHSKRIQIQNQIWKEYPETKYARLLPTQDMDDVPFVVTDLTLGGTVVGNPILYPNRVIVNYGTALAGLDRNTKEPVWKLSTPEAFTYLIPSTQLLAFKNGVVQKIYPDTGKKGITLSLPNTYPILQADLGGDSILVLNENPKDKERILSILDWNGKKKSELKWKDLNSFAVTKSGNLVTLRENKKEFLFSSTPLSVPNPNPPTASLLKKGSSDKIGFLGCGANSCLVKVENQIFEIDSKSKLGALPNVGNIRGFYETEDTVHIKTEEKIFVWKSGLKWSDSYPSDAEFRFPVGEHIVEPKSKELTVTTDGKKKSVPWRSEKDGKRLTTITLK